MISTKDLSAMPSIDRLRRLTQSLAVLDAIIQKEWEGRYYSFNSKWDANEQMASMRNGEGDSWFCVFSSVGTFLKGFDHASTMAPTNNGISRVWPGVLDDVPEQFSPFVNEPAFSMQDTTFCIWCTLKDSEWRRGKISYPVGDDPDGSIRLLSMLDCNPDTYRTWAEAYYRRSIGLVPVEKVYEYEPLTEGLIRSINPTLNLAQLSDDLQEIGYPVSPN